MKSIQPASECEAWNVDCRVQSTGDSSKEEFCGRSCTFKRFRLDRESLLAIFKQLAIFNQGSTKTKVFQLD